MKTLIVAFSASEKMSEKRTRLSNGDKMAILEAIRIPGFKREDIKTPRKRRRL